MSRAVVADFPVPEERATRLRSADLLGKGVFGALLLLIVITAVPYGTNAPWLKAAFVCAVFIICVIAIVQSLISGEVSIGGAPSILFSMLALCVLAFLQTISFRTGGFDPAIDALGSWNAISADPYQTRFFALQILALTTTLALLYRYANTQGRVKVLIHVVIAVAVASALFGIIRQTVQTEPGFVFPHIKPGQGYAQFINKNHFAYLMEMAFGLGLGMGLASGPTRERAMLYAALLLPIWTALVLSNSRGGILAMLAQIVVAVILLSSGLGKHEPESRISKWGRSIIGRSLLIVCLVFGIFIGTVWVGGDRLVTSLGEVSSEINPQTHISSGATRNEIWRASWKMFTAHPMLGVGLGGYWVAITAYHDAPGTLTPQEAHNDYLELLASGGIVGLAIGVYFAIAVFRRVRENLASENRFQRAVSLAAVLGLTGVVVHSMVDFGLHMMINALVFVVLIAIATKRLETEGNRI
jgi:O-antigen ligase